MMDPISFDPKQVVQLRNLPDVPSRDQAEAKRVAHERRIAERAARRWHIQVRIMLTTLALSLFLVQRHRARTGR
jgi:hypothetical protein